MRLNYQRQILNQLADVFQNIVGFCNTQSYVRIDMDSVWITLFSLFLLYLVVGSVRQRLKKYRLKQEFENIDDVIIKKVIDDADLFDRAYLQTFRVPTAGKDRVEIQDLIETKQRIIKNLNMSLRHLPNNIPSETRLRENIQKLDYTLSSKIDDVRKRYKQGYWSAPLGDYFFKEVQKGRKDITQTKPQIVKMSNDPLPLVRRVGFNDQSAVQF